VDSPKFSTNGVTVGKLLKTEPSNNPPAPLYVHKSLSTLGALTIDSSGEISKKDTIYFYDKEDNDICFLSNSGTTKAICQIDNPKASINMRIYGKALYILDGNSGYMWVVSSEAHNNTNIVYKKFTLFLLTILMLLCILVLIRSNIKNRFKN
jgi:hypothetical protein